MNRHARRAFSLLELLIVIMIIGLLAALVGPNLIKGFAKGQRTTTRAQIELLSGGVNSFFTDVGRYPTEKEGLGVLVSAPQDAEGWDGPYLEKEEIPKDGWKNDFVYKLDEKWGFIIMSYGADGQVGGEGDNEDMSNR